MSKIKSCKFRMWSNESQSCICEYDTDDVKLCDDEYCAGCQVREEKEEDI